MEKRSLYGMVVMVMYLVGGGYSQGVVKRIRDKAEWEAILADADHYIGLIVTPPLCGAPCAILNDQVARIVDSFNSFGVRIEFFRVNLGQVDILSSWGDELSVIIFKHGNVIIRYADLPNWRILFDALVSSTIVNFAPSPSDADFPLPPQSG